MGRKAAKHQRKVIDESDEESTVNFNPYEILGLESSCSSGDIKKKYHLLALKWHPDRSQNADSKEATEMFQKINRAYSILSDDNRRKLYDSTGSVDASLTDFESEEEWLNYWRVLYPKITIADIKEFEKKYKGSEEELNDLKEAYTKHNGDMDLIMEEVILAEPDDEDRFRKLLNEAIERKEIRKFRIFTHESLAKREKRRRVALKEAEEAEEMAEELGIKNKSEDELKSIIQARSKSNFENMMANLEAKYAPKPKGKKKK